MAIFITSQNKTPSPIKAKIEKPNFVGGTIKWAKVHNDRLGVAAPHVGDVFDRRSFSGGFSCKRTADPEHSSPTYYTSMDAVFGQGSAFLGLIDT
jgi:hypothetical protein